MRADEFLVEAGLENSQLRKHSGKYLQVLINKIKAGDPLEIVPDKQARFGDKVIVDASAADDLLMVTFVLKNFLIWIKWIWRLMETLSLNPIQIKLC